MSKSKLKKEGCEGGYELNLDNIQFKDVLQFVTKIDYSQTKNGCDLWIGGIEKGGYGRFRWKNKTIKAHRFAYALYNGPIPAGLIIRHKCDNPKCVRGDHLLLGTALDNTKDAVKRGRIARGTKHGNSVLTEEIILQAAEDYKSGVFTYLLSEKYGVNRSTLEHAFSGKTWSHLDFGDFNYKDLTCQKGEGNNYSKLTESDVKEIHRLWQLKKYSQKEIAEIIGKISRRTIGDIVKGRTWSHLGLDWTSV